MTEQRSTADRSFIECAKSALCFFCGLTVLLGALPWLVYGISDNLSYNKYVGKVIEVSEFAPARNIFIDSVPASIAEGKYEYYTKSGGRRQGSFIVFEDNKEKYAVGSDYVVYTHEGWSGDVPEYSAKSDMRQNIIFPLIFIIPALIAAFIGAAKSGGFFGVLTVREMFPKGFIFSLSASLLSGAVMVYVLFIRENNAGYFAGLAEAFAQIEAIALCVIALIAEIIIWSVSIYYARKY
ncbi:MAG: hypothetical protein K2N72_08095 [Oscillospiraceae bacterium]|nr:hypothetical protein [Oscillospiraceae bacterium]